MVEPTIHEEHMAYADKNANDVGVGEWYRVFGICETCLRNYILETVRNTANEAEENGNTREEDRCITYSMGVTLGLAIAREAQLRVKP